MIFPGKYTLIIEVRTYNMVCVHGALTDETVWREEKNINGRRRVTLIFMKNRDNALLHGGTGRGVFTTTRIPRPRRMDRNQRIQQLHPVVQRSNRTPKLLVKARC